MRVKIGPYKNWVGPYQLAEFICFWTKNHKCEDGFPDRPDYVHRLGEWLAHGSVEERKELKVGERKSLFDDRRKKTWLYRFLEWIDSKKGRTVKVHIDDYDFWNADETMSYIILPILKKLKEDKQGAPYVDDEDVPEELRSTSAPPKENKWDTDANHFKRWDYALDEMIFAFETKVGKHKDWEDQFHSGNIDFEFEKREDGTLLMVRGENDTSNFDLEGKKKYQERITNGFRLFGKYYEGLWS